MDSSRALARSKVVELVAAFSRNREHYASTEYDEAKLRVEYLDPFFKALGWDVHNERHRIGDDCEVVIEDRAMVRGHRRRPDYGFRIARQLKFFVEAKRPSRGIEDRDAAFQIKTSAWAGKAPLGLLTNFAHLRGFDGLVEPHLEAPEVGLLPELDLPVEQYEARFDLVFDTLSHDAVAEGNLDRFVEGQRKARKGGARRAAVSRPMDAAFLETLEAWRKDLATELGLRNHFASAEDLAAATQRILDRIVFLRVCEDRGIEPRELLKGALFDVQSDRRRSLYATLVKLFRRLAPQYNGTLFAEHPSEALRIEKDEVLERIIKGLYDPSPYRFDVVRVDLLGSIYERFLGSTIRLTAGGHAKVDLKPEVRHAGGVYYTPRFIVDAIIEHTLGPLTKDKTPDEMLKLRVVDPACGSGGFLLAAFQYLVEKQEAWFASYKGPKKFKSDFVVRDGTPHLTLRRKQEILTHCIFGVDIDAQAVEVAQMSLYLQLLEGERDDTLGAQLDLRATYLPTLIDNIRRGNSLVSSQDLDPQADWTAARELHPFDWNSPSEGFGRVMDAGGFDAVIGNPPYVRIQELAKWAPREAELYRRKFRAAKSGSFDLYMLFIEQALTLAPRGRLGFILPNKFMNNDAAANIRGQLGDGRHVERIVNFGAAQVFDGPATYTCLLFLSGERCERLRYELAAPGALESPTESFEIEARELSSEPWLLLSEEDRRIWQKVHAQSRSLSDHGVEINRGSSTGADEVFILRRTGTELRTRDGAAITIEPDMLREPISAEDFSRHVFAPRQHEKVIFPYRNTSSGEVRLLTESELRAYPRAYDYLASQRSSLEKRSGARAWFGYAAPRSLAAHERSDILVPLLAIRGSMAPTPAEPGRYTLLASGGFSMTLPTALKGQRDALLALLNSDIWFWILRKRSTSFRGNWITCTRQFVQKLPVPDALLSDSQLAHDLSALGAAARAERPVSNEPSFAFRTSTELKIDEVIAEYFQLTMGERNRIFSSTRPTETREPSADTSTDVEAALASLRERFGAWTGPQVTYEDLKEARRELWEGYVAPADPKKE